MASPRLHRWLPALLAVLPFATGCATPLMGDPAASRDILEIKNMLKDGKDASDSNKRQIDYKLETLDDKIQQQNELIKNNTADLERLIRQQSAELDQVRQSIAALGVQRPALQPTAPDPVGNPVSADPETAYLEALKQYNLGRYDVARASLEKILAGGAAGETSIKAKYWLGETCQAMGDQKAAFDAYKAIIAENPSHSLAWKSLERLGDIYQKQGNVPDALKLYNQIVAKNPNYEGIDRVKDMVKALESGQTSTAPAGTPSGN